MTMKTPLSASDIEVLLHYHMNTHRHPRYNAPAVSEATEMFMRCGMIETSPSDSMFITTQKGAAMVKMLCRTPEPKLVYVDAEGKEL